MTLHEKPTVQNKFALVAQPFAAVGAIDCTYINILVAHVHEEAYINHHGNHSLNVQAVSIIKMFYVLSSLSNFSLTLEPKRKTVKKFI